MMNHAKIDEQTFRPLDSELCLYASRAKISTEVQKNKRDNSQRNDKSERIKMAKKFNQCRKSLKKNLFFMIQKMRHLALFSNFERLERDLGVGETSF